MLEVKFASSIQRNLYIEYFGEIKAKKLLLLFYMIGKKKFGFEKKN